MNTTNNFVLTSLPGSCNFLSMVLLRLYRNLIEHLLSLPLRRMLGKLIDHLATSLLSDTKMHQPPKPILKTVFDKTDYRVDLFRILTSNNLDKWN